MALQDHPFEIVIGALLGLTAAIEYGVMNVSVLETNLQPFATWIFVGSFGIAYLLSERALGNLTDWELMAFLVGLGAFAAHEFVPQFATFVTENQPYAGIGLVIITLISFHILREEMGTPFATPG